MYNKHKLDQIKTKYVFVELQLLKLGNLNATKRQLQKCLPGKMYTTVENKQTKKKCLL